MAWTGLIRLRFRFGFRLRLPEVAKYCECGSEIWGSLKFDELLDRLWNYILFENDSDAELVRFRLLNYKTD